MGTDSTGASGLAGHRAPAAEAIKHAAEVLQTAATREKERAQARALDHASQVQSLIYTSGTLIVLILAALLASYFEVNVRSSSTSAGWVEYRPHMQRVHDTNIKIQVTLSQLFRSETVNVTYSRTQKCDACAGAGGHGIAHCHVCRGQGLQVVRQMVGPGMYRQVQAVCSVCGGSGRSIQHRCKACGGSGMHENVAAQVSVLLSPGLRGGDLVRIPGEGNQHPSADAGDVMVTLEEVDEEFNVDSFEPGVDQPAYVRVPGSSARRSTPDGSDGSGRGLDLETHISIGLREMLIGFSKKIRHLGGAELTVSSSGLTQPGSHIVYRGWGLRGRPSTQSLPSRWAQRSDDGSQVLVEQQLPAARQTSVKVPLLESILTAIGLPPQWLGMTGGSGQVGDLYVRVDATFPKTLSKRQEEAIQKLS